jgi:hypothetical protein
VGLGGGGRSVGWVGTTVGASRGPPRELEAALQVPPVAARSVMQPIPGPAAFCLLLESGV